MSNEEKELKELTICDLSGVKQEDSSLLEGLKYRKECLTSNKKDKILPRLYLLSSEDNFIFKRREEKDSQFLKPDIKENTSKVFDYFPGLPQEKYGDTILFPKGTLVIMGWVNKVNAPDILKASIYASIKDFLKEDNYKISLRKNDFFVDNKKVCGIEEHFKFRGVWAEAFINVESSFSEDLWGKYLKENKKYEIGSLKNFNPRITVKKFKKKLTQNYKEFFEEINEG